MPHPLIEKISFTGSSQVGWDLKAADPRKAVTLVGQYATIPGGYRNTAARYSFAQLFDGVLDVFRHFGLTVRTSLIGAVIGMKELPDDAWKEARVALAGPILGSVGAAALRQIEL